jgi:effector-binding domain-containing protein
MKKLLLGLFVLAALILLTAYIIIPNEITVSTAVTMKGNMRSVFRCLADSSKWEQLFGKRVAKNTFEYNDRIYKVNKKLFGGLEVLVKNKDSFATSIMQPLSLKFDSAGITWSATIGNSNSPFRKFEQYFAANKIRKDMSDKLENIKQFVSEPENIYGIRVQLTQVKDTLLVMTKNTFKSYPSVEDIYGLIMNLQNHINKNGARETGYPMLNSDGFFTRVAIPINESIPETKPIEIKRMVPGKILVAEVKGGPVTVTDAFASLHNYVQDYNYSSPAIPFQSLITNRLTEKDTSKWITKLYFPVY